MFQFHLISLEIRVGWSFVVIVIFFLIKAFYSVHVKKEGALHCSKLIQHHLKWDLKIWNSVWWQFLKTDRVRWSVCVCAWRMCVCMCERKTAREWILSNNGMVFHILVCVIAREDKTWCRSYLWQQFSETELHPIILLSFP